MCIRESIIHHSVYVHCHCICLGVLFGSVPSEARLDDDLAVDLAMKYIAENFSKGKKLNVQKIYLDTLKYSDSEQFAALQQGTDVERSI